MISERQLARGFGELWREVVPLLTPQFVQLFNVTYREDVGCEDNENPERSISKRSDMDAAVVAEFAFHVARLAHQRGMPLCDVANDEALLTAAESLALSLIGKYVSPTHAPPESLNDSERSIGLQLVGRYDAFFSAHPKERVVFLPRIPGCGFVNECAADLVIGDCLFEVKTVERNIAGKDIRQLLVYLALQSATDKKVWRDAGFFNPRRRVSYRFSVDKMIPLISGGRVASEVFRDMVELFCTRNMQYDSVL